MANCFGMFYDKKTGKSYTSTTFSQEYIPQAHQNPKTPIHAKMYAESRERTALKRKKERKKESEKAAEEAKKQYIKEGSGHKKIVELFKFSRSDHSPDTPTESTKPKAVSAEKEDASDESNENLSMSDSCLKSNDQATYTLSQVVSRNPKSPMYTSDSSDSVKVTKVVSGDTGSDLKVKSSTSQESFGTGSDDKEDEEDGGINVQDIPAPPEDDNPLGLAPSPEFVCVSCGNKQDNCHQYMYGSYLVQEAISFLDEKELDKITEDDVRHRMRYMYNTCMRGDCYMEVRKFDLTGWYNFPDCLEEGGVKYALKMARNQQIFFHLKNRREGGVVGRTMLNRDTTTYDYSGIL